MLMYEELKNSISDVSCLCMAKLYWNSGIMFILWIYNQIYLIKPIKEGKAKVRIISVSIYKEW